MRGLFFTTHATSNIQHPTTTRTRTTDIQNPTSNGNKNNRRNNNRNMRRIHQLAAVAACISHYMLQTQLLVILLQMIDTLVLLRSEVRVDAADKRQWKQRVTWSKFSHSLSDKQFRQMFRMPRDCVDLLCSRIIGSVGDSEFKSEAYLEMLEHAAGTTMMGCVFHIHKQYCSGMICGEINLAITLRIMAGGSYLDLAALYVCGYSYVYS